MKKNKTCETCEHLCPFVDENKGNCYIDMKEVDLINYCCEKYKKRKD